MSLRTRKVNKRIQDKSKVTPFIKKSNKNNKYLVCFLVLCSFSASFVFAWCWHLWVESRNYTPFNAPKASLQHYQNSLDSRVWGTYRFDDSVDFIESLYNCLNFVNVSRATNSINY